MIVDSIISNDELLNELISITPTTKVNDVVGRITTGTIQELIINKYYPKLKIVKKSVEDDLKNGDFLYGNIKIDLKVANTTNYVSTISKRSLDNFDDDGWYLCFNSSFNKYVLIKHSWLKEKILNNVKLQQQLDQHGFIKGVELENLSLYEDCIGNLYSNI